jgi:hypothetical protein
MAVAHAEHTGSLDVFKDHGEDKERNYHDLDLQSNPLLSRGSNKIYALYLYSGFLSLV